MKNVTTLLLFLALSVSCFAAPRTKAEAKAIAEALAAKIGNVVCDDAVADRKVPARKAGVEDTEAYYIFDYGDDEGFIIVSGDDRMPEIVGYTDTGAFDEENMPQQLRAFLDAYTRTVVAVAEGDAVATENASQASGSSAVTPVAPLLGDIKWNQDNPYNLLCPKIDKEYTVTGCTATAIAQIMRYHQFPVNQVAISGYTTATKKIVIPAIATSTAEEDKYDWDNMLPVYTSSATELQCNAVAKLMYHVGVALKMDYNLSINGGSGASYSAQVPALTTFGYDTTLLQAVYRKKYTYSEWRNIILRELNAARPILYGGQSSGGGHSFVLDGIDSDGLVHINWGWGGSSDGYFDVAVLNPDDNSGIGSSSTSDGYYGNNIMVIGITPSNTNNETTVADGTYSSDWNNISMTIACSDADNTLYYNSKYTYLNNLIITVTNNGDNDFYDWSEVRDSTLNVLPNKSDDFPNLYISLKPHETKSFEMEVKPKGSAENMTYWVMQNNGSTFMATKTFNVASVADPKLTVTSITSNAIESSKQSVVYRDTTILAPSIKDNYVTYNVTITNTGGKYRGKGIYFGFYNPDTKRFTAPTKTVEIPTNEDGVCLSFTNNDLIYRKMAGLGVWATEEIKPFFTELKINYDIPESQETKAFANRYICYAEGPTKTVAIASGNYSSNDDCYYSTLYLGYAVTIPEGVKAYTAEIKSGSDITLTEITEGVIPANTGVVLEMADKGDYNFPATSTDITIGSDLQGVLESTPTSSVSGTVYVLNIQEGSPKFSRYTGANLGANKAFLVLPSSAKAYTFRFDDDEANAIHNVTAPTDGKYYNLQGMEVSNPGKGLYIHNGKKVIIK